ncbi:MAG: hypothetical protein JW963_16550 [Anaerolineales bacterium]|nr:hypothetical protein [Anaerolineales bacterium]
MYKLDMPEPRVPKFAILTIVILVVSVIALVLLIGLQRPDSSTQAGSLEFAIVTQEVTAGEDIVIGVNNATFYLPVGAINVPGSIAIFPREPNLFTAPGDTKWVRPLVVNVEFRDGQGKPVQQITFTKPAEICFKITRERWEDYTRHPNEYEVQTYTEEENLPVWEPLTMVTYPDRSQLCGQIDHFSLFALATKPETKIPLTDPTETPSPPPPGSSGDSTGNQSGGVYAP